MPHGGLLNTRSYDEAVVIVAGLYGDSRTGEVKLSEFHNTEGTEIECLGHPIVKYYAR